MARRALELAELEAVLHGGGGLCRRRRRSKQAGEYKGSTSESWWSLLWSANSDFCQSSGPFASAHPCRVERSSDLHLAMPLGGGSKVPPSPNSENADPALLPASQLLTLCLPSRW